MSRLAANPAASHSLSLRTAETATPSVIARNSGEELPADWIGLNPLKCICDCPGLLQPKH
jgi:hypothetical protein